MWGTTYKTRSKYVELVVCYSWLLLARSTFTIYTEYYGNFGVSKYSEIQQLLHHVYRLVCIILKISIKNFRGLNLNHNLRIRIP